MIKNFIQLISLILPVMLLAQAPGGVAGPDFWVKSDDAGNIATAWKDHSANADDIPAVGTWALSPADKAHNFYPYTTGYSSTKNFRNANTDLNPGGGTNRTSYSMFSAVRPTAYANGRITGIGTNGGTGYGSNPSIAMILTSGSGYPHFYEYATTVTTKSFSTPFVLNASSVFSSSATNSIANGGASAFSGGEIKLGLNGIYETTTYNNTNQFQFDGPNLRVGYSTFGDGAGAFSGDIMEVIWYKRLLTADEQSRVNTYLAIKNGVTSAENYLAANNSVVWDRTANIGYNNNIFGIARDNPSALHQKQAASTNINQHLIIGNGATLFDTNAANTNNLTDGQFLIVGDNGMRQSLVTTLSNPSAVGGAVNFRFESIWKVQNTGTVGPITVAWPAGITNLHLVRSTSNSFDATNDFIPMSGTKIINGVTYNTAQITFNNGEYFTFAGYVTAPGGVSAPDFWIKSDDAGNIATAWKDHSANADDIPAVGTWALSPADRAHNFHPYTTGYTTSKLFYNNNNSALHSSTGLGTPSNHSIFTSVRPTSATAGRIVGIDDDTNAAEPAMSITAGGLPNHYEWSNTTTDTNFTNPYVIGAVNVFSATANNALGFGNGTSASSGGEKRLGLNGSYQNTTFTGSNRFQYLGRRLRVGHSGFTHGGAFPGDIMEVVWYNRLLTTNEQSRVNTYLALKNGVTLAEDYLAANSNIVWNRVTNTGYNNNIFGVARDNTSALHQKQATSTNLNQKLVIGNGVALFDSNAANTNTLTDGQFLIVGDNGLQQTLASPLVHAAPGGEINYRFASIWKVQNTGAVGQVIIAWPKGINNFHLIVSSDGDTFSTSDQFIPMTNETVVNGISYNIATVNLNAGDYFTFGGYAYAPAGVVNSLSYWYRADKNAANTGVGTDITSWTDFYSGTIATQISTATLPKYVEGAANYFNFNPGVNFTAGTQKIGNISVQTLTALNYDIFTFTKEGMSSGGTRSTILGLGRNNTTMGGDNWDSPAFRINGQIIRRSNTGADLTEHTVSPNFSTTIPSIAYHTFTDTSMSRGVNGVANGGNVTQSARGQMTGGHIFGDNRNPGTGGDDAGFIGHLGETIIYGSGNLIAEDRRRVDSYMAMKYGITLGRVATDHYLGSKASATSIVWSGTLNTTYNNNVFGMARADIGAFEQKVSKSVNTGTILTVAKNNDFVLPNNDASRTGLPNDESYLLFGDNNITAATAVAAPAIGDCGEDLGNGSEFRIIQRKWLVQRTNNIGTTYLQANLAAYASSLNSDIYMLVADDANFTQNVKMIPGTKDGNNWTFAHNFDNEAAARYITFGGTFVAAPCEQCQGGTYTLRTGYQWNQGLWGNQTANQKLNIPLGNDADGTPLTANMYADYSENPSIEYYPNRYPRQYGGKWTTARRYDNTNAKDRHRITLSQPMKASFQISNINTYQNNKNNFEVIGYCNGTPIIPRITYAYNTSYHTFDISGNQAIGTMSWRGFVPNVSTANVRFDRAVDRIEIISSIDRTNARKTLRSSLYGDITLECAQIVEPTPDNVYVSHNFTQDTLATCGGETTMRIKVTNNNICDEKTIDLHQLLPAGLTYVPGSFNGNDLPAGTMDAATLTYSGNSLELSGLTLPRGEHWMYVDVANPGTAGTYPTQFTFEVANGLDPNVTYSSSEVNLNYYDSAEPTPSAPTLTLSIKDNVSCGDNNIDITYRMKIDNPNVGGITGAEILHMFDYAQVIGSVVYVTGEDEDGVITGTYPVDGSNNPIQPVGNNIFNLVDAVIPEGVSYIDITVNVGNSYDIAEVQALGISSSFIIGFGSGECAESAESTSNQATLRMCSVCVKPGATGTPLTSSVGILTKEGTSVTNWPESVPNGYLVLDGAFKGMVITHMTTAQINALTPVEGMLVFDTDESCVKLYRGAGANAPVVHPSRQGWVCIERVCID